MHTLIAALLGLMRRARRVVLGLYLVVAIGFLMAAPGSGWTWFIVLAGGLLCGLFWVMVAFWTQVLARRPDGRDGTDGNGHG